MHQYTNYIQPVLARMLGEYRQKCDFSQERMAENLRISTRSYSDLERGKSNLSGPSLLFFVLAMTEAEQLSALRELQDVICKLEYELDPMLPSSQPDHK